MQGLKTDLRSLDNMIRNVDECWEQGANATAKKLKIKIIPKAITKYRR